MSNSTSWKAPSSCVRAVAPGRSRISAGDDHCDRYQHPAKCSDPNPRAGAGQPAGLTRPGFLPRAVSLADRRRSLRPIGAFMKVRTAVITAAARNQRALPLQTLIDRDGGEKPVLAILVEQVLLAGVNEICVVVVPGSEAAYGQALGKHLGHVRFVAQPEPRGYGHAVWCARDFTGTESFLHLVGDHLYVPGDE